MLKWLREGVKNVVVFASSSSTFFSVYFGTIFGHCEGGDVIVCSPDSNFSLVPSPEA